MENQKQHKVNLRKAAYDDLESICDIYTQAFKGKTTPSTRQWWNILDDKNIYYIVAEQDGQVVGVASLITINKLLRGGNRVAQIEDVAVSKYAGSRGIGSMLIERLKEIAVERGCYKTILNCSEDNIDFYKKCDFYLNEVQMRWDRPLELGPKSRNKGLF
jgi:ribosomal protein S18 acetylase RimI-like enzyme|tara:strand:+ start:253 stop:732 length:480 start_codon:yes stop_codon:yes gene_type:complete